MTADQIKKYAQKLSKLLSKSLSNIQLSDKATKKYTEYSYKDAPRGESHQIVTVGIQHSETLSSFYFRLGAAVFKEDFAPLKRKIYRLAKDNENLIIDKTGKQYVMTYQHPITKISDRAIGLALKEFYTIFDEILSKLLKSNFLNLNNADQNVEKSNSKKDNPQESKTKSKDSKKTKATISTENTVTDENFVKSVTGACIINRYGGGMNAQTNNDYKYLKGEAKKLGVKVTVDKDPYGDGTDNISFYGDKAAIMKLAVISGHAPDIGKRENGAVYWIAEETVEFERVTSLVGEYAELKAENIQLKKEVEEGKKERIKLRNEIDKLKLEIKPKHKPEPKPVRFHKWEATIVADLVYKNIDDKRLKKSALTFKIQTVKLPKRPTQSFFKTHLRQFVDKRGYYITKAPIYRIHGYGKDATITTSGFDHNLTNIVVQSIENDYF